MKPVQRARLAPLAQRVRRVTLAQLDRQGHRVRKVHKAMLVQRVQPVLLAQMAL